MYLTDLRPQSARLRSQPLCALHRLFPQVLAGPLVRWSEIMHQLDERPYREGWEVRAAQGVMLSRSASPRRC